MDINMHTRSNRKEHRKYNSLHEYPVSNTVQYFLDFYYVIFVILWIRMWIWWLSVKPARSYWYFIKLYEKPQDFRRKRLDGFYGSEDFSKERWENKDQRQFQVTSIFKRYWWIQFNRFSTSHFAYFINPERVRLVFVTGYLHTLCSNTITD